MRDTKPTGASLFLIASIAVTALLYAVPQARVIAYPLSLLSTLVHELGHGVAGWLVGGSFHSFALYSNGSGVAQVAIGEGRLARAFVSAGGLCGPAVAAAFGFALARRPRRARLALGAVAALLLLLDLLVVRNVFGWIFVIALAAILGVVALRANAWASQLTLVFLSVQLALSVFSRGDYLFTPHAQTGAGVMPSDVANMADALLLPYWFWGAACGLFSLVVLAIGALTFLRSTERRAPA